MHAGTTPSVRMVLNSLNTASDEPENWARCLNRSVLPPFARHRSKNVTLYRQATDQFYFERLNPSQPKAFTDQHGASANAMAFRVKTQPMRLPNSWRYAKPVASKAQA